MSSIEAQNLFSVKSLVAVITGGGSGIGLMMAKALEANGAAKVYIIGRRKEVLESAAKEAKHGNIIPLQGDVTSKDSLQKIVDYVKKDIGYVNVVIANHGISGPAPKDLKENPTLGELKDFLWNRPVEDFSKTFDINISGTFYTFVAFLELLDAGNKKGNMGEVKSQVIATSSIAGYHRNAHVAGYAYGPSKAAITHLIKLLATSLVSYNIRANAIAPGIYPSDMSARVFGDRDVTKEGAFEQSLIPARRAGSIEDMSGNILYLTSRAGAYCNGAVLITDGGRMSVMPATY